MTDLRQAQVRIRALVVRCPGRALPLERRVTRVLALLDAAAAFGRGHVRALEEAASLLGDLERMAVNASPQRPLFGGRTLA